MFLHILSEEVREVVYKSKKWEYLKRLFRTVSRKKHVPIADEDVIDDVLLGRVNGNGKESEKGVKQGF